MANSVEVQSGDTLSQLAHTHGSSVEDLLAVNPQIRDPDLIFVGQKIQLPDGGQSVDAAQLRHVVRQGDTLSSIGERYGVSADALVDANPQFSNPDLIYAGDTLNIPVSPSPKPDAASTYVVRAGDTLSGIAVTHGVSASAIAHANGISNPDLIYPGDTLVIPGPGSVPQAPIQPGEPGSPATSNGTFDYQQIAGVAGNPNVTPQFIAEVEAMAQRLGTQPEYLMAVMSFESGGSFSPSVENPVSGATGLIQFMPPTARGLGTSVEALSQMTPTEQLAYVEKYFQQYKGELGTLEGVYTSVLSGRARPDPNAVLFSQGTAAYSQNSGLDFNRDGRITSGEATSAVASRLYGGVSAVQQQLVDRGYGSGPQFVDGDFGPKTSAAIAAFQRDQGMPTTGLLNDATGLALFGSQAANDAAQPAPTDSEVAHYEPYTVYSTGGGTVQIDSADELRPHHDYQSKLRDGQTLEVRDVTIAHAGESHSAQTIPSPVSGEVLSAGPLGTAGNAVILRGDDGGLVYLFHMSRIDVAAGDRIGYGDALGLQGSTGHSSGDHVHIEAAPATIDRWVSDLLDGTFDGR